jgi:probable HAF family extracellular repeat protein
MVRRWNFNGVQDTPMKTSQSARFTTIAGLFALFFGVLPASAQSFRALVPDPVPPGDYLSPAGISGKGEVIGGASYPYYADFPWFAQAFRWTKAVGAVGLGYLPNGFGSDVSGVSRKGDVIVGTSYSNDPLDPDAPIPEAYRWTQAGGMVGLGIVNSYASAVSADGSIVVGEMAIAPQEGGYQHAFLWTETTGVQDLGTLNGGTTSEAGGISSDGSVVAGTAYGPADGFQAFRWTEATGMVALELPSGDDASFFATVSGDGKVIVGQSLNLSGELTHSFRWTERRGTQSLGTLSPGQSTEALAVSDDGSVIVGTAIVGNAFQAFRWTKKEGLRAIQDILVRDCKLDKALSGWHLTSATAVSPDGMKIVGVGTDPSGNLQGWEAEVPEGR